GTAKERMEEQDARLTDLEQRAARRGSSGPAEIKTLGQQFVEHPAYRDLETRDREGLRIHVKLGNDPLERKNITSAPNSGGHADRAGLPADRSVDAALERQHGPEPRGAWPDGQQRGVLPAADQPNERGRTAGR
ncbi:MAG: hypothetical protein PGN33_18750, partial [Methylobacterium radiotolerans]